MADSSFCQMLTVTLREAMQALLRSIGDEQLYAIAVCIKDDPKVECLAVLANTQQSLDARVKSRLRAHPEAEFADLGREFRWSLREWKYRELYPVRGQPLAPSADGDNGDALSDDLVAAMSALDNEGLFGTGAQRDALTFLLFRDGETPDLFQKCLRKLNLPAVAAAYLADNCPAVLYARLDRLESRERLAAYLHLYEDLALHRDTSWAREARRCNLGSFLTLGARILRLGDEAIDGLFALVERYVEAEPFNVAGSDGSKRDGSLTDEMNLAVSTVRLLGACDSLAESELRRLQHIMRDRLEIEAESRGPDSGLPDAIARVLHEQQPERFPHPQKPGVTNRKCDPSSSD